MIKRDNAAFTIFAFLCLLLAFGVWIKFTIDAVNDYNEAAKRLDAVNARVNEAMEQYAQMLAVDRSLLTLNDVYLIIDRQVASGAYSFEVGQWLKMRVVEIRGDR